MHHARKTMRRATGLYRKFSLILLALGTAAFGLSILALSTYRRALPPFPLVGEGRSEGDSAPPGHQRLPTLLPSLPATESRAGAPTDHHLPPPPQSWLIAIGIDQYEDDAIPACRGAVRDARGIGQWFAGPAGWGPRNVLYLDDLGAPDPGLSGDEVDDLLPTKANLGWAFRTWLGGRVHPGDTILIFFAGHAVTLPPASPVLNPLAQFREGEAPSKPLPVPARTEPGPPGTTQSHSGEAQAAHSAESVLLPSDARWDACQRTGWRLDEAIDPWAAAGGNPIVCWLATSPHGRGRPLPPLNGAGTGSTPAPDGFALLSHLVRWPGVTAWLAAEGRPSAEAHVAGALSPFAAALCAGLGSAERPASLLGCLDALQHDPALTAQGFRMLGGIDPNLNLWSSQARRHGLAQRTLVLQRGHAGGIAGMALTADGTRLITAAQNSTLKVWRLADRTVLRADAAHLVGVTCLDLSRDGCWLVSGDGSGRLRLQDLARDVEVPTGPVHERGVDTVAFLGDDAHFVSLDLDGASWFWPTAQPATGVKQLSSRTTGLAACRQGDPTASALTLPFAFVLAAADGKLRLYGSDAALVKTLEGPGGVVNSRRLATDGHWLAAADDRGQVLVWDAATASGALLFAATLAAPIDTLTMVGGPRPRLAVAAGPEVALVDLLVTKPQLGPRLSLGEPANSLVFSADGRRLAAATASGKVRLWQLGENDVLASGLEDADSTGRTTALVLSPDGRCLVSGDQDGGIRAWDLPSGRQRPRVPPRRGQVARLSASADGRYLLQISQDWQALVWDLQEGRSLSLVRGQWTSGALSPDAARLYLTDAANGDAVALDRLSGRPLPLHFDRPPAHTGAGPSTQRFGHLTVSPDGRLVAAGSTEGPLACVWDAASGRLVQTLRGHRDPDPITAMEFSADSRQLLTASEDGSTRLWDLSEASRPATERAVYTGADAIGHAPEPVSAAALSAAPGRPVRVAAGSIKGRVLLWEGDRPREEPRVVGQMDYPALALAFTPDGRWLAATGADKSIGLWDLGRDAAAAGTGTGAPRRVRLEPLPHHTEQVNTLVAWPGSQVLVSGSDDTTIKFWSLEKRALLGTLSAEQGTPDWVAYTPDGLFDSSIGGARQVTWHDEHGVMSLEQVHEQFHVYKLTDQLRRGDPPRTLAHPVRPPPRLALDAPSAPLTVQTERTATLAIALGEPGLRNLRLYQNGVPVRVDPDFQRAPSQQRLTTQVRLLPGLNRFLVMASRADPADPEGRSEVVELRYAGAEPAGRLHVLALGIGAYTPGERALQFAGHDARRLAAFLHQNSPQAPAPGVVIVLTDKEVTEAATTAAFATLRAQVRDRPEDTVVVFLAGHADMINGRFVLLLPSFRFPFPGPGPGPDTAAPAGRAAPSRGPVDADTVLPYVTIYRNLARLGALRRLVLIDACQAEAIGDDPGVRQIERLIDGGAQRARTAYLLAARRGEPAGESAALEHGLMTFALLKGLGAPGLKTVAGLKLFDDKPTADRNGDRVITTDELSWFVAAALPALSAQLPALVLRTGADGRPTPPATGANLGQPPHIQAADAAFTLIRLPEKPAEPDASALR